jgi:tetratricopeptide (TPR) repeat protein
MADPRRKAVKLEKRGDYFRAAEIYVSINDLNEAVRLYKLAEQYDKAVELLVELGRSDEAVELYLKLENYQKAIHVLKKEGDFLRAALICKNRKMFREAASLFEKSGILSEAARMYAEEHDFRRAAELYLRSNMMQSAAEAFESAAKEIPQKSGPFGHAADSNTSRALWAKAAKAWELAPNPEKAAKIYQDLLEWEKAGTLYESVGNFRKALFCFEQSDSIDATIRLLQNLNMHEKAVKLMAVRAESEGDLATAAQYALQQEDFAKAAEYFEQAGDYHRAATNYEKSQAFLLAAETYFKADNIAKAAEMYRMAGDLDTAAKLFEQLGQTDAAVELNVQSGNFSQAAQLLLDAGKHNEALRLLSRVPPDHSSQRRIRRLTAIAHFRQNNLDAGRKLVTDLLDQTISSDNVDIHYEYANALREESHLKEALVTYQQIVDYNKNYKKALTYLNWCAAMQETVSAQISDTIVGELPIGSVIAGRYELLELLGKGGMGVVYRAADRELNLAVALKILRPKLSYDPDFIEMFKREVTLARMLSHPNIIKIYDLNRMGNLWFVSMEYLEGEEVKEIILKQGEMDPVQVEHIARQILAGLGHSHGRNLIHSDVKPQNIFVDPKNHATLVDFGIARTMTSHSKDQTVYGTPGYISPEQITGEAATPCSDIYSLGVTLYEMLTGIMPFQKETMDLILQSQLNTVPDPPSKIISGIPEWMDDTIMRMIRKDPGDRFKSVEDVLAGFPSV